MPKKIVERGVSWLDDAKFIDRIRLRFPARKVLVTGGSSHSSQAQPILASAEIFDPATGTFSSVPSMAASRQSHVAVSLGKERIVVTGGLSQSGASNQFTATAELFAGGAFHAISNMVATRSGHVAALLYGGDVLVTGGVGQDETEPDSYTLASAETLRAVCAAEFRYEFFRTGTAMNHPRGSHTVTPLAGRPEALITGGHKGPGQTYLPTAEIYHRRTDEFRLIEAPMNVGRQGHAAARLRDGKVLIVGGSALNTGADLQRSAEIFDPLSETFAVTGQMNQARERFTAIALGDGRVLVAGGFGGNGTPLRSAEVFDPATGRFERTGDMVVGRVYHTATSLGDGRILFTGGKTAGASLASAEVFDPETGVFTATNGPMATGRAYHAAAAL